MTSACFASLKRSTVPTRYPVMRRIRLNFTPSPAFPPSTRNPFHILPEKHPTCVGKTAAFACRIKRRGKHPHVRGEDTQGTDFIIYASETPPRAWGRHTAADLLVRSYRNTPTCVGKTPLGWHQQPQSRKHPHVRGEDEKKVSEKLRYLETPPRAWGRHPKGFGIALFCGNTPTCVGKTHPLP